MKPDAVATVPIQHHCRPGQSDAIAGLEHQTRTMQSRDGGKLLGGKTRAQPRVRDLATLANAAPLLPRHLFVQVLEQSLGMRRKLAHHVDPGRAVELQPLPRSIAVDEQGRVGQRGERSSLALLGDTRSYGLPCGRSMVDATDDEGSDPSRAELGALRERAAQADAAGTELRRSQEITRRLIEAMPGGVVHVSAAGAIQTANAEALRILGLSYDEISNRYTTDFETQTIFEDGRACSVEEYPVSRALATGEAQPAQTIGVQRADGQTAWAIFTAVPIKEEGEAPHGAVVTFLDITERKQLEERLREAEKMQAIGRLAGGIAHDFNNLLTVVLANASEVQSALSPDDPHAADLGHVIEATRAASRLTSQLLSFARRQVIAPAQTALERLTSKTGRLLQRALGNKIVLRVRNAPNLWNVFVDGHQFEQVIINLVFNARDAIADEGVITLETENSPGEDGDEVVLRVRDNGAGIDATALEHVFEPFFTTKGTSEGVGLGLATCYGIVAQAGGTITAQSQPGEGSTFEVRLPRAVDSAPADTQAHETRSTSEGSVRVVLMVEDEPAVRRIVERILAREGYRVLAAEGGSAALSLIEDEGHLDLVLADVMMPGMLGPEVVRRVRELFPNVPALYMSGHADRVLNERGVTVSPGQLVHKPFEVSDLTARVREAIENGGP